MAIAAPGCLQTWSRPSATTSAPIPTSGWTPRAPSTPSGQRIEECTMEPPIQPEPATVVIFGAAGDLTWRKLVPALYNLFLDKWLPARFAVVGVDRKEMSIDEFRGRLREGVDTFSRRGKTDDKTWDAFASHLVAFIAAEFDDPAGYSTLAARLSALDKEWGAKSTRIFHLATPPD